YKCCLRSTGAIVGLFTLANDTLKLEYEDRVDFPNLASEYSDIFSRQCTYPAINIGHLAVRADVQSNGIGKYIVEFVRMTFTHYRGAGCQFITVDALNNIRTVNFYTFKLGFEFQTLSDLGNHTRRMYLDIFSAP
ncbi:MAG: GNAT family N-acetyltransferase, partial [Duncaniella sp.]|nr:GNAT family N-acetyltransferase [Duncaniella sp.]